jgi:hypothetical protein
MISTTAFIAGGVSVLGAGVLYLVGRQRTPKFVAAPSVAAGAVGMTVGARW